MEPVFGIEGQPLEQQASINKGKLGARTVQLQPNALDQLRVISKAWGGKSGISSSGELSEHKRVWHQQAAAESQQTEAAVAKKYLEVFHAAHEEARKMPHEEAFGALAEIKQHLDQFQKIGLGLGAIDKGMAEETDKLGRSLMEEQVHSLETLLRDAHIPQPDLEQLLKYYQHGWEGSYKESTTSGFLEQTHHIRGLKVHRNKNGKIVADIAIKPVGAGSRKAVKALYRITPSGELKLLVRYHAPNKLPKSGGKIEFKQKVLAATSLQEFFKDIQNELKVRERLHEKWRQKLGKKIGEKIEEIPNLLKIKMSGTYVVKQEKVKKRYTAIGCEGTVSGLVYRPGNVQEVDTPLPEESQQKGKALFCVLGAINGLRQMHEFGFVHKDVKDGNFFVDNPRRKLKTLLQSHPQLTPEEKTILFQRCSQKGVITREPLPVELQNILCELYTQCGLVGDFGFCAHVSDPYTETGTPAYLAPEINDPQTMHNNPKMDIFSLGATLLAIYNPKLSSELTQLNGQMCRLRKPFLTLEEYHPKLDELRKRLGGRPDSNALEVLISDALNFEPAKRPNAAEVQQRLDAALKDLLQKKEIFV